MPDSIVVILRYALIAGGTWVATTYGITNLNVDGIAGAIITIATALWGIFVRKGTVSVPADTVSTSQPVVSPITGSKS